MSKFNKKLLTASVLAALVSAGNVSASDTFGAEYGAGTPDDIATQIAPPVVLTSTVLLDAIIGGNYIGRTTGYQLRIELPAGQGVTFNNVMNVGYTPGSTVNTDWTGVVSLASEDTRFLAIGVTAGVAAITADAGEIDELGTIDTLEIDGANFGDWDGTAVVKLIDPNGSVVIDSATIILANFIDGVAMDCTPTALPMKIDVKSNGVDAAKTHFVPSPYTIGTGVDTTAVLGAIEITSSGGVNLGTAAIDIAVSATNLAGYDLYLSASSVCASNDFDLDEVVNDASTTGMVGTDVGFASAVNMTETAYLCADIDGTTEVAANSFAVSVDVAGSSEGACDVADIAYNGSVAKVFFFNPASNNTQQSFVRITNDGTVGGVVTIDARDDAGVEAGPVSFQLDAGNSAWLSATDLEAGTDDRFTLTGSLGAPTSGKRMLEITGEFDGMLVSAFVRNNVDSTLSNVTDVDNTDEQDVDNKEGQIINP